MINLTQFREKFPILLIPVLVITIIFVVLLFGYRSQNKKQEPVNNNSIKVVPQKSEIEKLPTDIKEIRRKIIESKIEEKDGVIFLFQSDSIVIRYVTTPDIFLVTVFKEPVADFKREAQNWFKAHGLKQENLCTLPVRFFLANLELKKANPDFSNFPDGCK